MFQEFIILIDYVFWSFFQIFIRTLTTSSEVAFQNSSVADGPSPGCAVLPVSDKCAVNMSLEGYIDAKKELARLVDKVDKLSSVMERGKKAMSIDGYETKVPEDVRAQNLERLLQQEAEKVKIEEAIKLLQTMKVE